MQPLRVDTGDLEKRTKQCEELAGTLSGPDVTAPRPGQEWQESTATLTALLADSGTDRAAAIARARATIAALTTTGTAYDTTDGDAAGSLGDQVV
jgi:hypothetical protein